MKNKPFIVGIILGTVYGLVARLLIEFNDNDFLKTMTIGFLFVTPAIIGAITVFFGTEKQRKSAAFQIMMPWVSIAAFLLVTMITLLEATACVVMLLPVFLFFASTGGVIMGSIKKTPDRSKTLSIFLFLPLAVSSLETHFANPKDKHQVRTEIIINADKQTVWKNIKSVDSIRNEELKWSFAHFIGMPKPIKSKLTEEKVGGVRNIYWDKGIRFREIINKWKPLESFSYDVIIDTIPPGAVDPHIQVGGEYFSVNNGGYELASIGNRTKLTLFCNYTIASKFNFYGKYWADLILDDFQVVILNVIKARCEKKMPAANSGFASAGDLTQHQQQ
jgi:uncharacterized membrane protein YeaQ/YmgE (transglycosylase-associated protein family)